MIKLIYRLKGLSFAASPFLLRTFAAGHISLYDHKKSA